MRSGDGERRREIIALLRAAGRSMTAGDVAEQLELHVNTVRFHMDVLERDGIVTRQTVPGKGPGRPPTRYVLIDGKGRSEVRNYRLLSEMLLAQLATSQDPHTAAIAAGAEWGRHLIRPASPGQTLTVQEGLSRLLDLLSDIGFDPESSWSPDDPAAVTVALRHCPFYELAESHRNLVCTLHFGLMSGALDRLGVPLTPVSLIPFARPTACVAGLRSTAAETAGGVITMKGPHDDHG